MEFTEKQPKDGDVMLLCKHVAEDRSLPGHFFYFKEGLGFARPTGGIGKANWLIMCNHCFAKHPMPSLKEMMQLIGGDAVWKGDEPTIKKLDVSKN